MGTPPQPVPFSTLRDGDLFQWPGGTTARQRVDRTHYRSYPDVGGAGHEPRPATECGRYLGRAAPALGTHPPGRARPQRNRHPGRDRHE
jgi:hypothetical protein